MSSPTNSQYEVLRTGNVDEMRERLSVALRLEKSGDSIKYLKRTMRAVQKKLEDLEPAISSFAGSRKSGEALKIQAKLSHALGRLDNMKKERKSELLAKALSLMGNLDSKLDAYEQKSRVPLPMVGFLERNSGEDIARVPRSSLNEELTKPGTAVTGNLKSVPPNKWNLKFSGNLRDMSLSAFMQQVEELRIARTSLKGNPVGLWYRFIFWKSLHDEDLLKEIEKRTQAKDESTGIYLAIVNSYFNRLTHPLSEKAKLTLLLRNIRPALQQGIGLREVTSIADLRAICRKLEEKNESIENFHEPPTNCADTLEPDLAYVEEVSETVDPKRPPDSKARQKISEVSSTRTHGGQLYTYTKEVFLSLQEGRSHATLLNGRGGGVAPNNSANRIIPILECILDHAKDDERPYLKVDVMGITLLGLLDSGATCTILGNEGWKLVGRLGVSLDSSEKSNIMVANGQGAPGSANVPYLCE
ncbi:hypothetical protein NQ318_022965 [Aromia moschata]|uniref:Peptidase A2 domain-containing protein n=1 Tax=Aromia moschata TaxID=1265417 RepID=A0AAV8YCP0_9CUCU|nr:hypothetical protein NQ318_022965 [Aromia moschata]